MGYRYRGKFSSEKKKKLAKGVACSLLALSVFSGVSSAFAWHFVPWIYHLPSADVSGLQDKFDWNLVKDTVNNGLNRLEKEERSQYGSNYYVDKVYSSNGKNYTWESYQWDWSSEGGGKIIISHFDFDTIGGTIATWRKYGEGDWVKERPPGWPYGDDFAMYSRLFDSNIPIRDMEVRTNLGYIDNTLLKQEATGTKTAGIVPLLRSVKDKTETRAGTQGTLGMEKFDYLRSISAFGKVKNLIAKFRDPKSLLSGLSIQIDVGTTPVNPEITIYEGRNKPGYTQEEIEKGTQGAVMKDKEAYKDKTDKEAMEAYEKARAELENLRKQQEELMKGEGNASGQTANAESPTSAKTREEQLRRVQIALKEQEETMDEIEHRRQLQAAAVSEDRVIMENANTADKTHMPTAKEFAKEMQEKRKKYSKSKDLGYRKFGQSQKANFKGILDDAIHPAYKKDDKIGKVSTSTSSTSSSGGT